MDTKRDFHREWEQEIAHNKDLEKRYQIWCSQGPSDDVWIGDTVRVIKCLMSYYREDEAQIIARLEASDIDNPVPMNDEAFWLEKDNGRP